MARGCAHLKHVNDRQRPPIHPSGHGCKECLESGDEWVHLRLCMTCGHVGCCDNSPNRHATKHFHGTQHPVVKSFEPREDWAWCYVDSADLPRVFAYEEESPTRHYSPPGH